jgi:hypothetical protein
VYEAEDPLEDSLNCEPIENDPSPLPWLLACPHEPTAEEAEDPSEDNLNYEHMEDDVSLLMEAAFELTVELSKQDELAKWVGHHKVTTSRSRPR